MGKYLTIILKEMCQRVGADFDSIDFKSHGWYYTYGWTKYEEENFKKWLSDYLYNNIEARKELMTCTLKRKYIIKKFADSFIFNCSWQLIAIEIYKIESIEE